MTSSPVSNQSYLTLNDGNRIPQLGIGVYLVPDGEPTEAAVSQALRQGYRHIDTAHAYQNERSVGRAVKASSLERSEVWITTKLWPSEYGEGTTAAAIDRMLERLDSDYIDLLLLHQQFGDYTGAWRDMERAVAAGTVRSIGVSNFESSNLEDLLGRATIKPSVNQVECHPYFPQDELREHLAPYGTLIESWYPLGHGDSGLLNEPLFASLGAAYGKTPAQVILRWHIQRGNIIFPKSSNHEHIAANMDIFDFALTAQEMQEVARLASGRRFYTLSLADQEKRLGAWAPED
ncbi:MULTISPECIES: aldo/keto reductase [unclassified Actinomyces]|uniref:aldo/keto reductase n=1 Tax=unclassified Actinomyces TaxID=2609248 RepID=UPI00201732B3|nr:MULTISPECIES: aldo/keto reductase [unclassified Actinomyces]MCL3777621.1 aldo/keto reductase [Actinomyces sp. AC-20-1]MCL3789441.1 aldo/keto reductase [Actinomyces sp. 187325]MCL3791179.1 aldo/keto reductase [Actinomyces sp. 186855]MCL3794427.1 aldo/keto reductase [Actinomyces sp. 217892]